MTTIWEVNRETREHRPLKLTNPPSGEAWERVYANADGFIPWSGESFIGPVPFGSKVELLYHDKDTALIHRPERLDWRRGIIGYRPNLEDSKRVIYAVNEYTKEHRRVTSCREALSWGEGWGWVEADEDGWIPWLGGEECPLPVEVSHDVKFQDALTLYKQDSPESWYWHHKGVCADIIAYRPTLDTTAPEAPNWDGEGLPPVGVECECSLKFAEEPPRANWNKIEVLYADKDTIVGRIIEGSHAKMFSNGFEVCLYKFRPIRIDEDRAVEAIEAAQKRGDKIGGRPEGFKEIYRAICAGDVPGIKLEDGK